MVIGGAGIANLTALRRKRLRVLVADSLLLGAAVSVLVGFEAAYPTLPVASGPFEKLRDREPLADWAHSLRQRDAYPADAPVLASDYKLASLLAFYLPDHPATQAPLETGSGSAYHEWLQPRCDAAQGWYFSRRRIDGRAQALFDRYDLVESFEEHRNGVPVGWVHAYYGRFDRERVCAAGSS